ncbi:hypothetical protein FLAT13_01799 [Flavobacterium salmonis]|uniref:Uncharacterized protein n=1 Tax=Flavobacterium salmonis TaxID=2654844 RepID=A0A6V6YW03_9FLAO|nr:hypothetical protein FLAT13_01799 [Flavobacterium salmonis]
MINFRQLLVFSIENCINNRKIIIEYSSLYTFGSVFLHKNTRNERFNNFLTPKVLGLIQKNTVNESSQNKKNSRFL